MENRFIEFITWDNRVLLVNVNLIDIVNITNKTIDGKDHICTIIHFRDNTTTGLHKNITYDDVVKILTNNEPLDYWSLKHKIKE